MKQAALQLKTRIRNVNIMNNNVEIERVVLNIMLSPLAGLALWYALILGNMVFDIVQRRALEKEILVLTSEVNNLELSYLSISSSVDMALSQSMGFKEATLNFATRKSLGYSSTGEALGGSLKLVKNEI